MSKTKPKLDLTAEAKPGAVKVAGKPPRRDPTVREKAAIDKATAYCRSRTEPLRYVVTKVEGKEVSIEIPHNDAGGFLALQRATFGTASAEFAARAGGEVGNILRSPGAAMPDPDALNAGVAAVSGIAPENEAEAMLAVQMVGTHSVAMEMLSRAKQATTTEHLERYGTLATKLLRTYTTQMEALSKMRRGGTQKVVVEHVHVYQGGQAIVGNVTSGGGAQVEKEHQPHALTGPAAVAFQADPSMLCSDPERNPVPVTGSERKEPMPNARRRPRKRSAQG